MAHGSTAAFRRFSCYRVSSVCRSCNIGSCHFCTPCKKQNAGMQDTCGNRLDTDHSGSVQAVLPLLCNERRSVRFLVLPFPALLGAYVSLCYSACRKGKSPPHYDDLHGRIFPEDILRPYVALTAHGFIWHGILLFISLLIIFTGCTDASSKGLCNVAVLFVILSVLALGINIAAEPVMPVIRAAHPAVAHEWAAMFYLNPFHVSPQPVVSTIQKTAGIPAGLVLYMLAIAFVSSVVIKLFKAISRH